MAQKKSDILESLISQLEKKQADISCFLDLIDDYMALYDIKKKLKTDIKREEYPMRHNLHQARPPS